MSAWFEAMFGKIKPVDVVAFTAKTVTLTNGRRANRTGSYREFYPTWEEAHAALVREATEEVESLRRRLEQANGTLGNIRGMKCPEPTK